LPKPLRSNEISPLVFVEGGVPRMHEH
jgi:hypothetical protein